MFKRYYRPSLSSPEGRVAEVENAGNDLLGCINQNLSEKKIIRAQKWSFGSTCQKTPFLLEIAFSTIHVNARRQKNPLSSVPEGSLSVNEKRSIMFPIVQYLEI